MVRRNALFSKDFGLVAAGQIISIFGNQVLRYALPLYLLTQTGSSALFGAVSASAFVPMIVLFPIGGIIADRLNKRNIMVVLDFSTAILILAFSVIAGKVDIVPVMTATMILLYGIQGAYQPVVKASVPVLVEARQLVKANSVVDMINSVATMAGPVVGGLLFSVFGLAPILYVSIVCFFAAAAMEAFIHIPFEKRKAAGNIVSTGLADLKESFAFMVRTRPVLWKVSLVFASANLLLTSLVMIGLPVIITQHLGFAPDTANRLYGYAQGVVAAGAILGGLLAGVLSNRMTPKTAPLLLIGCSLSVMIGGAGLQLPGMPMGSYLVLVIGCGLLLVLNTLFQIQVLSYLQLLTPKELIGKVISCFMCVAMCTSPLGQFIYGLVFEGTGDMAFLPFYLAGLAMIGVSIATRRVFSGIDRQIEGLPQTQEGEGREAGRRSRLGRYEGRPQAQEGSGPASRP